MSLTVGRYTFGAWLRRGIGRSINEPDTLGAAPGAVLERATVPVDVQVNTLAVHKDFSLLGPGDVVGINPDAVVRTEPRDWVTDFEPNYLAFVEFYDEDFLWRYTPARPGGPSGERLRPWLALLVLEEETVDQAGEFTRDDRRLPLPVVTVLSTASLPPHTQTWAWGHVHTNEGFAGASDFEQFLQSLHDPDHPNADRIISRLASPRKLLPNRAYGAFVVPAFETGRRAGLGQDPAGVHAQAPAWTAAAGSVDFPIYYSWRFRTGENEDFESLIKRLEPRPADPRVGIRDMDAEKPGWGLTATGEIGTIPPVDRKQSVLGLEGALRAPATVSRPVAVDTARDWFVQLQDALNFPEALRHAPAAAELPVVSPPIYGEHHALRHSVDVTRSGWIHTLNRDPRTRVSAGFGVRVVQENQEGYVARAWTQVQKVLDANREARLHAWAMHASVAVYANLAARMQPAQSVTFLAPLLSKVRGSPTTLHHLLGQSTLPPAAVSGAMRRMTRARGPLARRLAAADPGFSHAALVEGMADGSLTAAPPKQVPGALATDADAASQLPGARFPAWLLWLLRHRATLLVVVLVLLLLLALLTGAWLVCAVLAVIAIVGYLALGRLARQAEAAAALTDPAAVADAVERAPPRDGFQFTETDPVVPPVEGPGSQVTTTTDTTSAGPNGIPFTRVTVRTPGADRGDTLEAAGFRRAAAALNGRLALARAAERPARPRFELRGAHDKLHAAVNPLHAFPLRLAATVNFTFDPSWLTVPEHLVPAMVYPDFDDPMYEKLRDISSELLLPNLQMVPPNTITLLRTNPQFIESYLVGLNYEFGKELLWREYPTDRRGSYFRQFWDVRGILDPPQSEEEEADASELGKDVTPLDTWGSQSPLGAHRNPKRPTGEQLVLTIRGDLLKKYPGTLVYAQKAHVARADDGTPRPGEEPKLAAVATDEDVAREIEFPVFRAQVDPDIRFFGFDLNVAQARGAADPRTEADDWGYYFVIQQLPGEPRFGMDVQFDPDDDDATPITWDDLGWDRFPAGMPFVDVTVPPSSFTPAGPGENAAQWGSDSARMASILYQKPVMIAVHAKEMLEGL